MLTALAPVVVQGRPAPKSASAPPYAERPVRAPRAPSARPFGKGKGRGKGNGRGQGRGFGAAPGQLEEREQKGQTVPADFPVDATARYLGTVTFFNKWKGFGFVELAQKGIVPTDTIFVHWRNIQTDDRFPFLIKDLQVEFGIMKWKDQGAPWTDEVTLRAKTVTLPGGGLIALQDVMDDANKEFVGTKDTRYSGTLKFYSPKAGYGYIVLDEGFQLPPDVPAELRVERSEVNAGGKQPQWMASSKVEFGIWKTSKDAFKAHNMTLPGGVPVTQAAIEHRQDVSDTVYNGTVAIWNWKQGWGFIKVEQPELLPAPVQEKLAQQSSEAKAKAESQGKEMGDEHLIYFRKADVKQGVRLRRDIICTFQLYIDDKGVGAAEIDWTSP